jgi:hypothetical protein
MRYTPALVELTDLDGQANEEIAAMGDLGRHIFEVRLGDIYTLGGPSLRDRNRAAVVEAHAQVSRDPQVWCHLGAALNVGPTA